LANSPGRLGLSFQQPTIDEITGFARHFSSSVTVSSNPLKLV
jgi:hypothetical protein